MKKKLVKINDIPQHVLDSIVGELLWYSTGLVKVDSKEHYEEANLIGSGTFIRVDKVYGILTAYHVAATIRGCSQLGLVITLGEHRYNLETEHLHIIDIAKPSEASEGPDLSFIRLPDYSLGTLRARKSFYNLSFHREKVLQNPLDYRFGLWMPLGFPEELTKIGESVNGFSILKDFHMLGGATGIENAYVRGDYDYLEVSCHYRKDEELPMSFGGFSGGGLWQVPLLELEKDNIKHQEIILSGVIFYQTKVRNSRRNIKCHGRRSIYKKAYEFIRRECIK